MANGIEDLMNIRTMGGTQNVPPRPPMNPMQGGLASMGGTNPTMPPVVEEQRAMPPMGGQEMPSEQPQEPVSAEQDGAALAQAVVGRANGDIGTAIDILDNAKAMLMQSGQEEPMMMAGGGELNPGLQALQRTNPEVVDKILKREMGGPLYAQDGMPLTDAETMKQMIMNSLSDMNNIIEKTDDIGIDPSVSSISNFNELAKKYRITTGKDVPADFYNEGSVGKDAQQAANAAIAYQMSLR
jgi:hypothetical protein